MTIISLQLAATEIKDIGGNWREIVLSCLQDPRWKTERKNSTVSYFPRGESGKLDENRVFRNGFLVQKVWLGPGRGAIGIVPKRRWYKENGMIDHRPEFEILEGAVTPNRNLIDTKKQLEEILQKICEQSMFSSSLVALSPSHEIGFIESIQLVIRESTFSVPQNLNTLYRRNGFDYVPRGLRLVVIPAHGVSSQQANQLALKVKSVFQDRNSRVEVVIDEANDLNACRCFPVLVLLPGNKKSILSQDNKTLLQELDAIGCNWRRSYIRDNLTYSVPDQIGSILQAAGGRPFAVRLIGGRNLPWSLGLDLSHPRRTRTSLLCAALVDPKGSLFKSWTIHHNRDEAISKTKIRKLMSVVRGCVPKRDWSRGLFVLRDGRLFERESFQNYLGNSQFPTTLVELRKYNNPPLLPSGDSGVKSPVFALDRLSPSSCKTGYFVPLQQPNRFGRCLKVHWQREWNQLNLGSKQIGEILIALTYAPGLGNRARVLPAPIYWADGIAGANDEDLRFRGQCTIRLT